MLAKAVLFVSLLGWISLAGIALLLGVALWAVAPLTLAPRDVVRTAWFLSQAPFADRVIIGDSRVVHALDLGGALPVGYGGAPARNLERISRVVCALAPGPVTIAMGINDTRTRDRDLPASRLALEAIARSCKRPGLAFAPVWPVELVVRSDEGNYAPGAISTINAHIAYVARQHRARLIEVPRLAPGFTYDGVHFIEPVARLYGRHLIGHPQS